MKFPKIASAFNRHSNWKEIAVTLIVALWCGFFFWNPINITTGDIGRHLQNGRVFFSKLHSHGQLKTLLHTNFYSYTATDFPFINHHWGSGVIFYGLTKLFGFTGLSFSFLILNVAAFLFFFWTAVRRAGLAITAPLAFTLVPFLADRTEIRPEALSYLFCGIFVWLLSRYLAGELRYRTLLILPILELFWANMHIYFILGLYLVGIFFFEKIIRAPRPREEIKKGVALLLATTLGASLTPFGFAGLSYPFRIFHNYGFPVMENMAGWQLLSYGWTDSNFFLLKLTLVVVATGFVVLFIRRYRPFPLAYFLLGVTFGWLAWTAVRNYALFGLFMLPTMAILIKLLLPADIFKKTTARILYIVIVLGIIIFTLALHRVRLTEQWKQHGLGLLPHTTDAAEFFLNHHLPGPMFNDFDNGGYVIYSLFPQYRPFVDNRPEAYPAEFFQNTYLPLKTDESVWQTTDLKYQFNSLFISMQDRGMTKFILARLTDSTWAPVFADRFTIIFLKRNALNQSLIKQFEIQQNASLRQ